MRVRWNDQWNQVQEEKKRVERVIEGLQDKLNRQRPSSGDTALLQNSDQDEATAAETAVNLEQLARKQLHLQSQLGQA